MKRRIYGFVGLVSLVVLLFVLLHTAPGKDLARRMLSNTLSAQLDSELSLGQLDYRLWRGELTLQDLTLASDSFDLDIARIEANISLPLRIGAVIRRPRLTVRAITSEETTDSGSWSGLPASIRRLELSDGQIRVEHEEIDAGLVVGGIEIQLDEKEGGHRSFLKSGKGQLVFEDTELTLEPLEAILEWKGTEILVSEATVRVGTSHARVQGALRPSPLIASLDVDYQVDPDLLRLWAPEMEMTGLVNGRAHFEMDDTGVRLQGDFRSSALTVKEIGPLEVGGEVQLTDDALELASVSLKGYGGTAELEGRVALRDGEKHNFRLRFSELDVASLTLGLTEWEPPLASRASGEARISLADWRLDDAEGRGRERTPSPPAETSPSLWLRAFWSSAPRISSPRTHEESFPSTENQGCKGPLAPTIR
jgi:autotransporter translocation and assembly factor TamB